MFLKKFLIVFALIFIVCASILNAHACDGVCMTQQKMGQVMQNGFPQNCPPGEFMTGMYGNGGAPTCIPLVCPTGSVLTNIDQNGPVCTPVPDVANVIKQYIPAGPQGPQGPPGNPSTGHYTILASRAVNSYSNTNNSGYESTIFANSYCLSAQSSIFGYVNGMNVALQENPNPQGANINSISFLVPNGASFNINAYCASGGYVNVYAYTYN